VTIVQLGDSHTAADFETGTMRRLLQTRFGDGGRGFVSLGLPWGSYRQDGIRGGMTKEWLSERPKSTSAKLAAIQENRYGLLGVALTTAKRGARAWTDVTTPFSKVDVHYLEQPGGGTFELKIDGATRGRISTRGALTKSGFYTADVPEAPHRIELSALGDGEVHVFGATLDRATVGVSLDALGINGARVTEPLKWDETHMTEQLRRRAPSLVILAYGTNEAGDETTPQAYERQIVDVLGRLSRAVPAAACVLLGPPDRAVETKDGYLTSVKLLEVISTQRRVAEAAGCAFYNQFEAMGGDGSIAAWALEEPPRAAKDRVHLSRDGYAQLGSAFTSDLLRAYEAWKFEKGFGAVTQIRHDLPIK
jgi:lysophospholipase L1-like esterase